MPDCDKLIELIDQDSKILILSHENPDPDGLASAAALRYFIMKETGKRPTIAYAGVIGRAENRALVAETELKLTNLDEINLYDYNTIAIVDCQVKSGNSPLLEEKELLKDRTVIVIDHHPAVKKNGPKADYVDMRENVGASASILTRYLSERYEEIPKKLATALFYAIRSETQNLSREATKADKDAFEYLFPQIDNSILSRIETPKLPKEYFRVFGRAIDNALVYDDVIISSAGAIDNPDIVPQLADEFLRLDSMNWAFCIGYYEDKMVLSIRAANSDAKASRILRKVVDKDGSAGGHAMMAGGRVPILDLNKGEIQELESQIKTRFLEALKVKQKRGVRLLVDKKSTFPRKKTEVKN